MRALFPWARSHDAMRDEGASWLLGSVGRDHAPSAHIGLERVDVFPRVCYNDRKSLKRREKEGISHEQSG